MCFSEVDADRIMWVITVPAIWKDAQKLFMREAALQVFDYSKQKFLSHSSDYFQEIHTPTNYLLIYSISWTDIEHNKSG